VGTFTKALGMPSLWRNVMALAVISIVYYLICLLLLRKQED